MNLDKDKIQNSSRWIGKIEKSRSLPTFVLFGGVHGNEQTGIAAIEQVFETIESKKIELKGSLYGIRANLKAIEKNKRFIDFDLNRVWKKNSILKFIKDNNASESSEAKEIKEILDHLIKTTSAPLYFVDLHTTSSESAPFVIIDDTIRNRRLANTLPVTKVLGIIEKLQGTMMGHYGDKGPVSIVFEAGKHENKSSTKRHIAAIWLLIKKVGLLNNHSDIDFKQHKELLKNASVGVPKLVETKIRFQLKKEDEFEMKPGLSNFSPIHKGELIAYHNQRKIYAKTDELIFMPLYQKQGEDGFFTVKKIAKFWILVSKFLRRLHFDKFFHFLPGISKDPENPQGFIVNKKIASFKTIEILHLFGFRKVKKKGNTTFVFRRPYDFKGPWD